MLSLCRWIVACRLRVAMGVGIVVVALLGPATPAPGAELFFQAFRGPDDNSPNGNLVVPFRVGATGLLSQVGFVATGGAMVQGVAVRHQFVPGNDHQATVFAANFRSGTTSAFTVRSDGGLSPIGSPVPTGPNPITLAVSPDGRFLYAANHDGPPNNTITGFRIAANGALTRIGSFDTRGSPPWGLSVSQLGVLYAVHEGLPSVAAMRINSDGTLTHLSGSPYPIPGAVALTDSEVDVSGRFLFVTAGLGDNAHQGVWSFVIDVDGTLKLPARFVASAPIPIDVEAAPNGRHLYVDSHSDRSSSFGQPSNGGVSGYAIGSGGSLTRVFGATSADAGTPFFTGGQQPHALELLDRAPTFLFVGHQSGQSIAAFNVNETSGLLTEIARFGTGGIGDTHFSNASTTTGASSIVNRDRNLVRFLKTPGGGDYRLTARGSITAGAGITFTAAKPRRIVPVPGSGCVPFETADSTGVRCDTTFAQARIFTTDGNNIVNAQDGFPQLIICGSGFDTLSLDLQDPAPFNCDSVTRAPVKRGTPARPVGRSARVKDRVAVLRLGCARNRQGGRCKGRVVIEPCPKRRVRCKDRLILKPARRGIGSASYSIRAGRRQTLPVPLSTAISGRRRVRVLTLERARDGRPMTGSTLVTLRG